MDNNTLSFKALLSVIFEATGKYAPQLKKSIVESLLAAFFRALGLLFFVPLFFSFENKDIQELCIWAGVITVMMILSNIFVWMSLAFDCSGDSSYACDDLRRRLGRHLRKVSLQYISSKRSGNIAEVIGGNVDYAVSYTSMLATTVIDAVVVPIVVGVGALYFDWRLGVCLLIVFPVILPIYLLYLPRINRNRAMLSGVMETLKGESIEFTQGLAVLKSAGCVGDKSSKFKSVVEEVEKTEMKMMNSEAPPNILLGSAVEFGMLLFTGAGTYFVSHGDLNLTILAALMVSIVRFAEPLSVFISMFAFFELSKTSYMRISEFLHVEPLAVTQPTKLPDNYNIKLEDVSFCYATQTKNSLSDITLDIDDRSMTALVGPSGCGKTTLVRMISRYDDPQNGTIKIGDVDIRSIEQEKLNSLVSFVFQDVYLFDDTIFENIKIGRSDATEEDVYQAARQANCHEFVEAMPNGYQTRVGDIGSNLSGGEKQRISIARALLKNAPIVVLDEPTAALDTHSEVAVQSAIDKLVKERTVIVIAHRLSTIVGAQKIVVIENGRIVEQGSHSDLLNKNGRYASLWNAQQCELLENGV